MRITMRGNVAGEAGAILEEGETYDVADNFARALVFQGRAVVADGEPLEDPGVVTMNGDAMVAENRAAKAPRKR